MNEFEIIKVQHDLLGRGYHNYNLRPGNDCIWATVKTGGATLEMYYIFRDGYIFDVQVD